MVPLNILYRFIWSILLQPAKASDVKSWVHYTAHYVTLGIGMKILATMGSYILCPAFKIEFSDIIIFL